MTPATQPTQPAGHRRSRRSRSAKEFAPLPAAPLVNAPVVFDNASFSQRSQSLWQATQSSDPVVVEAILKSSPSIEETLSFVNNRDPKQSMATPLHAAAQLGNTRLMQLFVDHGANINARDAKLNTPLHYAAMHEQVRAVRWLVDHGAQIEVKNAQNQIPAALTGTQGLGRVCNRILTCPQETRRFDKDQILSCKPKSVPPLPSLLANLEFIGSTSPREP